MSSGSTSSFNPTIVHLTGLNDALDAIERNPCNAIIADLSLLKPDVAGNIKLLQGAEEGDKSAAVLVIVEDENTGIGAITYGADEFLLPNELSGHAWMRLLNSAVARCRTGGSSTAHRFSPDSTSGLSCNSLPVTEKTYGQMTMQQADPENFHGIVKEFSQLIDLCMEEHMYRVPHSVSTNLNDLAFRLGRMKSGPRDVVEIYGNSLKEKLRQSTRARAAAYSDVGQILALELMGYLVSYYRMLARFSPVRGVEEV